MTIRRGFLVAAVVAAAFIPMAGCKSAPQPDVPPEVPPTVDLDAWPFCVCGEEIAATMLDQIEISANDARAANTISVPLHAQIITRITKCRGDFFPSPLTYAEHCTKLTNARNAAWACAWGICLTELEHGH